MPKSTTYAAALIGLVLACGPAVAQSIDGQKRAQEAARAQGQGNLDQALTLYSEALQDTALPNERRALILTDRGALLARLNQPKPAIDDFNRAVQLYPEYAAVYNDRGSVLLTLGHTGEAIKDFERALLLAPGYVAAYNNRAGAHMLLGHYPEAIADYTKAIELAPSAVAPLNGRGKAELAVDRPLAATRDFSRALQADNRFALGYRNRAAARIRSAQFGEAVEDLSRAAAFDPNNAQIYLDRGQAYNATGNVAAAVTDFGHALELQPRFVQALESRAIANIKLEAQDDAEADILRGLEIEPRSAALIAARAVLYLRTGQNGLAQREIEKAARIDADRPEVLWAKGEVEDALGRRDDAVGSFRAALAARPTLREASDALERLGASSDESSSIELQGLGGAGWSIQRQGRQLVAVRRDMARLKVPIEMAGDGDPRVLEWETKRPPYKDYALLRISTGSVPTPAGPEPTEQVALIDISAGTLLAVVPDRVGSKRAKWSWDDNKVTVAAVDGLTDEITLKGVRARDNPAVAENQPGRDGRRGTPSGWLPWEGAPTQRRAASAPSYRKPKTLFDILFGN